MRARVVGTGSIGSRYLRILADMHDRGELEEPPRAIPIRGVLRPVELASRVIVESALDTGLPGVQLTIIATRTGRHVADALAFGAFTERMLIEKPVSTTVRSASELADLATRVPTAVCAPLRFMAGLQRLRGALPEVGDITSVHSRCRSWLPDWRPETDYRASYSADPDQGGVLRDLVHEIDIAVSTFGMPRTVSAQLSSDPELGIPVDTTAHMAWTYPSFMLHMDLDYVSRVPSRGVIVRGTAGSVEWDILAGTVTVETSAGSRRSESPQDLDRDRVLAAQMLAAAAPAGTPGAYACARLGDGIRAVAITEFARASSASAGATIPITIDAAAS